jgi:hypothetical protein
MRGLVAGCEIVKKDEVSPLTATTRCHLPLHGVFGFGDGWKKICDIITWIVSSPGPTRSTDTRPRLFPIPNKGHNRMPLCDGDFRSTHTPTPGLRHSLPPSSPHVVSLSLDRLLPHPCVEDAEATVGPVVVLGVLLVTVVDGASGLPSSS